MHQQLQDSRFQCRPRPGTACAQKHGIPCLPAGKAGVLCFDDNGFYSFSSLLVLEHIIRRVGDGNEARPCEHSDLICGTGLGGLIALFLGRLGMIASVSTDLASTCPLSFPTARRPCFSDGERGCSRTTGRWSGRLRLVKVWCQKIRFLRSRTWGHGSVKAAAEKLCGEFEYCQCCAL